jgi:hypothetical protein
MPVFDNEKVQDALKVVLFYVLCWDLLLEMLHLYFAVRVKFNCLELEIKGSETLMAYRPTILCVGKIRRIRERS